MSRSVILASEDVRTVPSHTRNTLNILIGSLLADEQNEEPFILRIKNMGIGGSSSHVTKTETTLQVSRWTLNDTC